MILILKKGVKEEEIEKLIEKIKEVGLTPHVSRGEEKVIIGLIGDARAKDRNFWLNFPQVEDAIRILKPFKLASREFKNEDTIIDVNSVKIGGKGVVFMAGPCAVENREMIFKIGEIVKNYGAKILRGGVFKPRTSPYSFRGLGKEGIKYLKEIKEALNIPIITEVMSENQLDLLNDTIDIIQIGARNMQNFTLLEEVGKLNKPILLKRGMSATIEEFLLAAEYILSNGNYNVILCERGIRTFETYTRNTLDISAIPLLKSITHLPVIVDPSHATGDRNLVIPVSLASIAAGCDGILVEVHIEPDKALSDGYQSLYPEQFKELVEKSKLVSKSIGRYVE
jgi:3-deoxy-7-phosphoheptulonate synthase